MHTLQRRLRRATGFGVIAVLALPLAAQAADYRAQLSESLNSGLAAAHPTLALRADFSNADGGGLVPTGLVRFNVDTRHLSASAWNRLMAAPSGTQLGTITSDFTGAGASPLRVLGHGTDTTGAYVRAGVDVPGATAAIIGSDNLTVIIRRTTSGAQITYQLDWRSAAGKLAPKGVNSALHSVTLALRGVIVYSGAGHVITQNPTGLTAMTNSVIARACAQPACTTLRPASVSSSATVHLPKMVTLAAPVSALYGYRYSIGGTGRAGDAVSLESLATNGLVPARGSTMVKPDGTFVIRATLRSVFTDDGDLALSAGGRYAVASVEGGNATVYGIAGQDTRVTLAQPHFVLQRKTGGKLLHFSVRIPGADQHVRVAIKLGSKTIATGYSTKSGTFSKTIVKPTEHGNLRVVASVPGADTAISNATPFSH
jgi:hypothetical protein